MQKLKHKIKIGDERYIRTTVCIPEKLRAFVLSKSNERIPGTHKPIGISNWIVSLIFNAQLVGRNEGTK